MKSLNICEFIYPPEVRKILFVEKRREKLCSGNVHSFLLLFNDIGIIRQQVSWGQELWFSYSSWHPF
jgi:hypothetical protein